MRLFLLSLLCEKPRAETCIVNDGGRDLEGVCGRPASKFRRCPAPVCATHLCQHRCANGHQCWRTPLRLAYGDISARKGWVPDGSKSANCRRHEKYNCVHVTNGSERCPGAKVSGSSYCAVHEALLCRWEVGDSLLCGDPAYPGSSYCTAHCWCGSPFLLSS